MNFDPLHSDVDYLNAIEIAVKLDPRAYKKYLFMLTVLRNTST